MDLCQQSPRFWPVEYTGRSQHETSAVFGSSRIMELCQPSTETFIKISFISYQENSFGGAFLEAVNDVIVT